MNRFVQVAEVMPRWRARRRWLGMVADASSRPLWQLLSASCPRQADEKLNGPVLLPGLPTLQAESESETPGQDVLGGSLMVAWKPVRCEGTE